MAWLNMKTAMDRGEYRGGNIGPGVDMIDIFINDQSSGSIAAWVRLELGSGVIFFFISFLPYHLSDAVSD